VHPILCPMKFVVMRELTGRAPGTGGHGVLAALVARARLRRKAGVTLRNQNKTLTWLARSNYGPSVSTSKAPTRRQREGETSDHSGLKRSYGGDS
jgi:hypothetical protein